MEAFMSRTLLSLCLTAAWLTGPAYADRPRVAVDIAPIHALVAQVMEGIGMPDLIIQPGATPHEYSLRPSEAAALQSADLVFWIGPDLTPWLEEAIETLAPAADLTTLMDIDGTVQLEFREDAVFEAHDHSDHADDDDLLARYINIGGPFHRMDEETLIVRHALPVRDVGVVMVIIALAHPKEVAGEAVGFPVSLAQRLHRPEVGCARKAAMRDGMAIADVRVEVVLLNHLTHILQDLFRRRDWRANPRFEPVAESVEVRVGTDTGIFVRVPRATETVFRVEDCIGFVGALLLQVHS